MKRSLWLLMLFLLAGHVPAASADSACEGRFVNPITDICWSCIFPLSLGSIKVSQGKVPDTANPSMPIQICPAPPPLFRRIGLAIGYWEPMARRTSPDHRDAWLTWASACRLLVKRHRERRKRMRSR